LQSRSLFSSTHDPDETFAGFSQPKIFELAINLKTVKVLGSDVPPLPLAQTDEVIE
jgi:hypothetical protein